MVEIAEGVLLVASYSDCSYFIVDLKNEKEDFLNKGFSPYALGLQKFPKFNIEKFPYVLAKEDDYLSIINVRSGSILRLMSMPTHN